MAQANDLGWDAASPQPFRIAINDFGQRLAEESRALGAE
jgi:hypothetical protein